MDDSRNGRRRINLALQGGGTHGAFTWGVLDRLLEDDRVLIEGISGTSAGAMNGAVLAQAFQKGGAAQARAALDHFWRRMSQLGALNLIRRGWYDRLRGTWNLDRSPGALWVEMTSLLLSPYQTNPLNRSRLGELLAEIIDFDALRACDAIKMFVAATDVRAGLPRIFKCPELSVEALLASACMPQTFQAVTIDGEAYWDGGYMGNPALWPLIYECESPDILIVQVNPIRRDTVPQTAADIINRLNEITFNASLIAQLRAISLVTHLVNEPGATGPQIDRLRNRNLYIHLIGAETEMRALGVVSQANTDLDFLLYLKALGRKTADEWLAANFTALNQRSTFDPSALFI
jgi:NTE family protein